MIGYSQVLKAIERLKTKEAERVTTLMKEAAALVAAYVASLTCGAMDLPRGYKVQNLLSTSGLGSYLILAHNKERFVISLISPVWDSEGLVLGANSNHFRRFARDVAEGWLGEVEKVILEMYAEKIEALGLLRGKFGDGGEGHPKRRVTDFAVTKEGH